MEQNLNLSEKYYAYDLYSIFDIDEAITFYLVLEPNKGYDSDDYYAPDIEVKDGNLLKIMNWDSSFCQNIYYLFHKPGHDVVFDKVISYIDGNGTLNIDAMGLFKSMLQKYGVEYKENIFVYDLVASELRKSENGCLLHKMRWNEPEFQSWIVDFNQGFKKIDGKYELNKIECNDPSIVYDKDLHEEMLDLSLENDENEQNRTEILNSHTEKLSALLSDDNAEMDANSFADLVYHLKQHFHTVTVWGMQGSYLRMAADDLFLESDNPSLKLIIYGAFQIMESNNITCPKRYRFRCESAQDLKTYLVGYIKANTVEKQTNFIAKCIMLGKAQELPERMDTLDFEELDEEE